MVAGALGGFLTGLFATTTGTYAFGDTIAGGAIEGNGRQVWVQIVGALFIIGWNLVWTSLIMMFIKYVLRIPLRMSDEDCLIGDDAIHGEEAYCFNDDVSGLVPTRMTEDRADKKLAMIHGAEVLHGRDVEEGNNGQSSSSKENGGNGEIKID